MTAVALLFVAVFIAFGMALLNRLQLLIDSVDSAAGVFADLRDELVRSAMRETNGDTLPQP